MESTTPLGIRDNKIRGLTLALRPRVTPSSFLVAF